MSNHPFNPSNPYVGPRPFEPGEQLYGRDQVVRELIEQLIGDRIVLLHSLSGAGKTSIINTMLFRRLHDERFFMLATAAPPPTSGETGDPQQRPAVPEPLVLRVNRRLTDDEWARLPVADLQTVSDANPYVLSILLGLNSALPVESRLSAGDLAHYAQPLRPSQREEAAYASQEANGLARFLAEHARLLAQTALAAALSGDPADCGDGIAHPSEPADPPPSGPAAPSAEDLRLVLVFDQFEEAATLDPLRFLPGAASPATSGIVDDAIQRDPTGDSFRAELFLHLGNALQNRRYWALFAMRQEYVAAIQTYAAWIPTSLERRFALEPLTSEEADEAILQPARAHGVNFSDAAAGLLIDNLRQVLVMLPDRPATRRLSAYIEPVQLQVVCFALWQRLSELGHITTQQRQITVDHVRTVGDVDSALEGFYAEEVRKAAAGRTSVERGIRHWIQRQLIVKQGALKLRGQVLERSDDWSAENETAIQHLERMHLVRRDDRGGRSWYELAHDRLVEPVWENNENWIAAHRTLGERFRPWVIPITLGLFFVATLWSMASSFQVRQAEVRFRESTFAYWAKTFRDSQFDRALLLGIEAARMDHNGDGPAVLNDSLAGYPYLKSFLWGHLPGNAVTALAFNASGTRLASAGGDSGVGLWDVTTRQPIDRALPAMGQVLGVSFNSAGEAGDVLGWAGEGGCIFRSSLSVGAAVQHERPIDVRGNRARWLVQSLAWSPDGSTVAAGGEDQTVCLWSVKSGVSRIRAYRFPELLSKQVFCVAIDPSQRSELALGGRDAMVVCGLADPARNAQHLKPGTRDIAVLSLAFNQDGSRLASGHQDGTVLVWRRAEPGTWTVERRFEGSRNAAVRGLAYSRRGWLAAAGENGKVRVWDPDNGEETPIFTLDDPFRHPVESIAFAPDRDLLASGNDDGYVLLWDLASARTTQAADNAREVIERACAVVNRNMTQSERKTYLMPILGRSAGLTCRACPQPGKPEFSPAPQVKCEDDRDGR